MGGALLEGDGGAGEWLRKNFSDSLFSHRISFCRKRHIGRSALGTNKRKVFSTDEIIVKWQKGFAEISLAPDFNFICSIAISDGFPGDLFELRHGFVVVTDRERSFQKGKKFVNNHLKIAWDALLALVTLNDPHRPLHQQLNRTNFVVKQIACIERCRCVCPPDITIQCLASLNHLINTVNIWRQPPQLADIHEHIWLWRSSVNISSSTEMIDFEDIDMYCTLWFPSNLLQIGQAGGNWR